jgi:hypothetical protein
MSKSQIELLQKINEQLPLSVQRQFATLNAKRQDETLTPAEHQELLRLIDQIEQANVDRLRHLLELAQIQEVSIDDLLGSTSSLSDEEILRRAEMQLDADDDRLLSELLYKQQAGNLAESERSELDRLMQIYQIQLLRKAQALAEAAQRGLCHSKNIDDSI